MTQPFKLIREGTEKEVAQACGKCGRVYALNEYSTREADECCDAERKKERQARDQAQRDADRAVRHAAIVARAPRIAEADYSGPVWVDEPIGNEGYFASVEELREECEDDERPLPDEVWTCTTKPFALKSAARIIEEELENGEYHDSCDPDQSGPVVEALQAAIDAYNGEQSDVTWFSSDTLVVLEVVDAIATPPRDSEGEHSGNAE